MADNKIRTGELFAGIGGIGLGLEATGGFEVVWQVENDPYAIRVLEKNWPAVRRWDDVKTFPPEGESWDVDLITAGFPCTDISNAGNRKGLEGEKSKLFYEIIRITGIIKPRWLLLENVSAVLVRGIGAVLGEVASISGSDDTPHFRRMEYHCLPAAVFGAPHRRDRFFLLADSDSNANPSDREETEETDCLSEVNRTEGCTGMSGRAGDDTEVLADSDSTGLQRFGGLEEALQIRTQETLRLCGRRARQNQWGTEPDLARMVNGVPKRLDRTRCLGNAVVPQVAQFFGQLILDRIEQHD